MNQRRPYYLITGLVLGLLLGMLYARVINPPVLVNLIPGRMNAVDQDQYRLMISLAYQADGDLGRANARLDLLGDNPVADLASQAQRMLAGGGTMEDARVLALLAQAIVQPSAPPPTLAPSPSETPSPTLTPDLPTLTSSPTLDLAAVVHSPTPTFTPSITLTGAATFTPRPTNTPQPTAGAPFLPQDSKAVCDVTGAAGRLMVEVQDAAGKPVAGVRIVVNWPGGQDTFYTGLHPQVDPGYADFSMSEGITYSVRAGEGGQAAEKISTGGCGTGVNGGWTVLFRQP
jgi:hypothetical protein